MKEGITKSRLNEFYYGRNDFLTLQNLLSEFTQQDQTSGTQQDVDFLNIFKSTLDAWKDVDQVDTFQNMMFSWDTGFSFLLKIFKAEFVYYMWCVILIKDVTKVKKVI